MLKRTVSLLLSVILLLGFCTSCGQPTAESSPKPAPKPKATASAALEDNCKHTFSDPEKDDFGCYRTETVSCSTCGGKRIDYFEKEGHTVDITPGVPVTCRQNGFTDAAFCETCDKTLAERTIIPLDIKAHCIKDEHLPANLVTGEKRLKTCALCGVSETVSSSDTPAASDKAGVPVIRLEGRLEDATQEERVDLTFSYKSKDQSFTAYATAKVQGNTSADYEKKNYSIKLYEDAAHTDKFKVDLGWGKEFKYCLKANYIDASHARNIVNARLYARLCRENPNHNPLLDSLPTMGVIDGFPVAVYLGDEFYGLYTLNIPKDKWLYDMKDDETLRQAILMADDWQPSPYFKEPIAADFGNGWDLEHCSTKNTAWVRNSFNKFISFVQNSDAATLREKMGDYVDVDSFIDTMLFALIINAYDNYVKNMLYVTYDGGDTWICAPYDLDSTWGLYWDGTYYVTQGTGQPYIGQDGKVQFRGGVNILWPKLFEAYKTEIKARYGEMRRGVMSEKSIMAEFDKFSASVPDIMWQSEAQRWPKIPQLKTDQRAQIEDYMKNHLSGLDAVIYGY